LQSCGAGRGAIRPASPLPNLPAKAISLSLKPQVSVRREALHIRASLHGAITPSALIVVMPKLHREWLDGDDALEVDILSCLLESIETALLTMQSA